MSFIAVVKVNFIVEQICYSPKPSDPKGKRFHIREEIFSKEWREVGIRKKTKVVTLRKINLAANV